MPIKIGEAILSGTHFNKSHLTNNLSLKPSKIYRTQGVLLSLGQMSRMPWITFVTILLIGISLALPAGLFVISKNVQSIHQTWRVANFPIMLYLKSPALESQTFVLSKQIQMRSDVEKVEYISPEQGLADFQKESGMTNLTGMFKENPLPALLIVTPKIEDQSSSAIQGLVNFLHTLPNVHSIKYNPDLSERLKPMFVFLQKILNGLIYFLSFGALLMTSSLIFWILKAHAQDIKNNYSVTTKDNFVPRILLYLGLLYGLTSGGVACLIAAIGLDLLKHATTTFVKLYGVNFSLQVFHLTHGITILGLSTVIGLFSAVLQRVPKV